MEDLAKLQSAHVTSKLGYTSINCAYSLELLDAQVHATGLVVVCVRLDLLRLGVIGNLHTEHMRDLAIDSVEWRINMYGPMHHPNVRITSRPLPMKSMVYHCTSTTTGP